jgi:hypothetical protein
MRAFAWLAELYRRGFDLLTQRYAGDFPFPSGDLRARQFSRVAESAMHLVTRLHDVPVLVVPCIEGRVQGVELAFQATLYGSIFPAVWSFMLALRARGIGSALTTDHLFFADEAAHLLGIPENVTQVALLPSKDFAPAVYPTGAPGCDPTMPMAMKIAAMTTSWTRNPIEQTPMARPVLL